MGEARRIRVVVADNHRAIRDGLRAAFQAQPDIEMIGEAADGNAALRVSHELRPDVLIVDISLPGLGGLDVIRALSPVLPEVKIVVFSLETRLRGAVLSAGAAAFVSKDAPETELLREIRRAAGARPEERPAGRQRLGEYLLAHGLITAAQLDAALAWQRDLAEQGRRARLGELLRELGLITNAELERALRREAEGLV